MRITNAIALTGLALSTSVNAIVNGTEATALDFPSIAGLYSSGWFGDSLICSGVVIGEYTVVTTATCVDGSSASSLKVRVGSADRTTGGTIIPVSEVIQHPSYSSSTVDNDYAVLHLSKSALEVSGVSAASLPTTDDATTGDDYPLRVGGWGKNMSSTSTLPQMLHQVNMVSVDQVKCNGLWKDVNAVTKNMICVQPDVPLAPGTSACNGDQGDPIVDETGQTVYGLVSWLTKDCSASPRPNVGSNFQDSSAKSWINGLTK